MRMGNKTRMLTNEESVFDGSIQACKSPTFNLSNCTLRWIIISMFGNVEIQRCMIVSVSGVGFIHSHTQPVYCVSVQSNDEQWREEEEESTIGMGWAFDMSAHPVITVA